jgi:26S proteasome non-ATPase regulatory subunit 9
LVEGDLIVQFGDLTLSNSHNAFQALAEVVPLAAEEHRGIAVTVLRNQQPEGQDTQQDQDQGQQQEATVCTVQLSPRPWSGRGLLGCHLVPYTATTTSNA